MPIFEYHCMKCDKDFETLVFGDQKVTCPTCKGTKVKKFLSTFSHK
ncbi:MAG: zinc ribbon domain-containing protein, partial [Deltaproteobacteria bacterium]